MTEKNNTLDSDYEKAFCNVNQLDVKPRMYITIIENPGSARPTHIYYSFEWPATKEENVEFTQVGDVIEVNRFEYTAEEIFPMEKMQLLWKNMVINFNNDWGTWKQSYGRHRTHTPNLVFVMPRKNIYKIFHVSGTMAGLGEIADMILGLAVSLTDAKKKENQTTVKWDCDPWKCKIPKDIIRELRNLNPAFMMQVKKDAEDELGVYYTCGSFPWEENDGIVEVSCVNKDGKKYFALDVDRCKLEPAQFAAFQPRHVFEIKCEDFLEKTPEEQNNMYWAIVLAFKLSEPEKLRDWGVRLFGTTVNRNENFS